MKRRVGLRGLFALFGAGLALWVGACAGVTGWPALDDGPGRPWRLVTGPRFFTGDPALPWAEGLVLDRAGRLVEVRRPGQGLADRAATGERLETIHLPGALATPGLGDGHVHLRWLAELPETLDLSGAASPGAVADAVAAFARGSKGSQHVIGRGWDEGRFEGGATPWAEVLRGRDPSGRPIALTRADGHALWLDPAALGLLESADLLDAPGQRVERDAAGSPTGLITDPHLDVWDALREPTDPARQQARLSRVLQELASAGLFEVHDMATAVADLDPLGRALDALGAPMRVVVYLEASAAAWRWLEAHAPGPVALGPALKVQGVKLFADGALGSRGAALHEPYADAPGARGQALDREGLSEAAARAMALGYDVAIHAIGDAAVDVAAEVLRGAVEGLRGTAPRGLGGYRPRIEHVQVLSPASVGALADAGVIASMQPAHALSDAAFARERLGPERLGRAYATRRIASAGIPLLLGSDAPIEAFEPLHTLSAAVLRGGGGAPDWSRAEALTPTEALAAMSAGLAVATGEEGSRGSLKVGMPLSLTLFDRDFVRTPEALEQARVLGRVWFEGGQVRVEGER